MPGSMALRIASSVSPTICPIRFNAVSSSSLDTVMSFLSQGRRRLDRALLRAVAWAVASRPARHGLGIRKPTRWCEPEGPLPSFKALSGVHPLLTLAIVGGGERPAQCSPEGRGGTKQPSLGVCSRDLQASVPDCSRLSREASMFWDGVAQQAAGLSG